MCVLLLLGHQLISQRSCLCKRALLVFLIVDVLLVLTFLVLACLYSMSCEYEDLYLYVEATAILALAPEVCILFALPYAVYKRCCTKQTELEVISYLKDEHSESGSVVVNGANYCRLVSESETSMSLAQASSVETSSSSSTAESSAATPSPSSLENDNANTICCHDYSNTVQLV